LAVEGIYRSAKRSNPTLPHCFFSISYQIFELVVFNADLHKGNLLPTARRQSRMWISDTGFVSSGRASGILGLVAAFQKGELDEAFAAISKYRSCHRTPIWRFQTALRA